MESFTIEAAFRKHWINIILFVSIIILTTAL